MKKLLIHSNNTIFKGTQFFGIKEQFLFDLPFDVKDVDFFIHSELTTGELAVSLRDVEVVFIKVALSQNYLEYIGLRLAYHIRLTKQLEQLSLVPIVFISEENIQLLGQTAQDPSILLTRGVYFISEDATEFNAILKRYHEGRIKGVVNLTEFIQAIQIRPSANYLSHHSIANEWSMLQWARLLRIDSDFNIKELEGTINCLLYYKYLLAKIPEQGNVSSPLNYTLNGRGKVLYIDDEWDKGWKLILEKLLSKQSSKLINLFTFETNLKDKPVEEIVDCCYEEIKKVDPEIIILDLRLANDDFSENVSTDRLSGFRLLQLIKKSNPGMQVVIFTASNKVWNLLQLQEEGADGFVLKESPEQSYEGTFTAEAVKDFVDQLNKCLSFSFLKLFFSDFITIKDQLIPRRNKNHDSPLPKVFVDEILKWLELANENLLRNKNALGLTSSFLIYFSVIENISNRVVHTDNPHRIVDPSSSEEKFCFEFRSTTQRLKLFTETSKDSGRYIKWNHDFQGNSRHIPWPVKILNTFDFLLGHTTFDLVELSDLIRKRNDIIHANITTGTAINITPQEIIALYRYIIIMLRSIQ